MARRYHRVRAEILLGAVQARSVIRLTDAVGASLQDDNSDHLRVLEGFAEKRSDAFGVLARYEGASRIAGRRFAVALNALGLLER